MSDSSAPYVPYVFLSYCERDYRDRALASAIAQYLQDLGVRVWHAPTNLRAGADWSREIDAAVLSDTTHFVVILSSASTASPHVAREVDLASRRREVDSGYEVLSLAVGDVAEFSGSSFLDRFQRVPFHGDRTDQLDAIADALGVRGNASARPPFLDGFVGRTHIVERVDAFVNDHDRGIVTILGDPGEGKSAVLSHLAGIRPSLFHANSVSAGVRTAQQCVSSLMRQSGLWSSRGGVCDGDVPRQWEVLLNSISTGQEGRPWLIIDALDEADQSGLARAANVLSFPSTLPPSVLAVVSRRREAVPLRCDAPTEYLDLAAFPDDNRRDATDYVEQFAERSSHVESWLAADPDGRTAAVDRVVSRSTCNFMYLRCLLHDVAQGRGDLVLERLPSGLNEYYADHWRRMGMSERPVPRLKLSVLAALAVSSAPLSRRILSKALEADPVDVQEVLDEWSAFLTQDVAVEAVAQHRIYHESFRSFLKEQGMVQAAGDVLRDLDSRLAMAILDDIEGDPRNAL